MCQAQVCRVEKTSNYTTMGNFHLRDKNLSLKAKGLLSMVLSLPPNWDYSVAGLVAIVMEKETVVRSCLKELREAGYLVVEKECPTKENGGHFNYIYRFYEQSQLLDHKTENSICENLDVESLDVEVLDVENQRQINTDKLSKEELKTDKLNKKKKVNKKEQLEKSYEIVCREFEDEELRQSWWDFLEMRLEQHNKTYTEKGIRLKIKEFKNSIGEDIELGKAALDQAVAENWVGWHINDSTKLLKNGYQADLGKSRKDVLYKPKDGEDITYQRVFEKWKQYLGASVLQTEEQVEACKDLLDDVGEEWVEKMIVGLRMRSQTNFVVREIKAIQDFVGLANNRSLMMAFCDEHWKEWELKVREAKTGKKPWEV